MEAKKKEKKGGKYQAKYRLWNEGLTSHNYVALAQVPCTVIRGFRDSSHLRTDPIKITKKSHGFPSREKGKNFPTDDDEK